MPWVESCLLLVPSTTLFLRWNQLKQPSLPLTCGCLVFCASDDKVANTQADKKCLTFARFPEGECDSAHGCHALPLIFLCFPSSPSPPWNGTTRFSVLPGHQMAILHSSILLMPAKKLGIPPLFPRLLPWEPEGRRHPAVA